MNTPMASSRWVMAGTAALITLLGAAALGSPNAYAAKRSGGGSAGPCDGTAGNSYAGQAYNIRLRSQVVGIDVNLGPVIDTGPLPATGGVLMPDPLVTIDGQDLPIPLPSQLTLHSTTLQSSAMGSGDTSTANSVVENLSLGLNNGLTSVLAVNASVLNADATRKCLGSPLAAVTDSSATGANIANLQISILGVPISIPASAPPNTGLTIPLALQALVSGSIMLNEQPPMTGGLQVVNAVHINLAVLQLNLLTGSKDTLATIDLIISHAEAGITCGTGSNPNSCHCAVRDFYTGGGQIDVPGGKASFAVNGAAMDSVGPKGHLNLVDHTTRQHIAGTPLTNYAGTGGTNRDRYLTFDCTDNLGSVGGSCTAHVLDTAESGGGNDSFGLTNNGNTLYPYALMSNGNLQLHIPNCGTTTTTTKPPKGHR